MSVYVGSLKFSPVYKSHCCAFGKESERQGYNLKYLFSKKYEWMLPETIKEKTIFIGNSIDIPSMVIDTLRPKFMNKLKDIFSKDKPDYVYLYNYSLLNHYVALLCKRYNAKFIYHVHEPYRENKKFAGGLKRYWLYFFEYLQTELLKNTDVAIVSSDYASMLFDREYPNFSGTKINVPLIYEDLGDTIDYEKEREYITFVGPPFPSKNPEKFLEIVRYSNENEPKLKFLLISRSPIKEAKYYENKNLEIFSKERITDEEYGELIKKSLIVLAPYKRTTQSSVVLVSYMYGTPVVSSNIGGLPEFVFHKRTGYILDLNANIEEWIKGIKYIIKNFTKMSNNCRTYFVENFSDKNWAKYLKYILKK